MSNYTQLSLEERCSIARLHEAGQSIRQIAAALDRQPSTITRELKRNTGRKIGYQPAYAQAQASARRWTAPGSNATMPYARPSLTVWGQTGRPSRSPDASPAKKATGSSVTRPSTVSSTPNSSAPTIPHGGSICPAPKSSADGAPREGGPAQTENAQSTTAPSTSQHAKHQPKSSTRCTSNVNPQPHQVRGDGGGGPYRWISNRHTISPLLSTIALRPRHQIKAASVYF